ncbi:MAG TPA: hypothetical protein VF230_03600 [Acidimicrobiales bacterium]
MSDPPGDWSPIDPAAPPPPPAAPPAPSPPAGAPSAPPPAAPPAPPPGWGPAPTYGGPSAPPPPPPPGWGNTLPKAGNARTGPLPLHPMSVGDILDGTFKLFKANARTVLLVTATIVVPVQLVSSFLLREQFDVGVLSMFRDPTVAQTVAEQNNTSQIVVAIITSLIASLVTPFIAGAVSRVVAASYLGHEITAGQALKGAGRRIGPLLGAFVLVHLLEAVGLLACGVGMFAVMAVYSLTAPAIAIEEIGAIAGMRRSWRLVRPRFWWVLAICLLSGFIANALGQILGGLPALVAVVLGGSFAWLAVALAGVLSQLVSLPVVTIAATLLYFDARIRHEGFDVEVMAADLASTR